MKEIILDEAMTQKIFVVFTDVTVALRKEVYTYIIEQSNGTGVSFAGIIRAYLSITEKKLNDSKAYNAFKTFVSRNYRKSQGKYIALTTEEKKLTKAAADKSSASTKKTVEEIAVWLKSQYSKEEIAVLLKLLQG